MYHYRARVHPIPLPTKFKVLAKISVLVINQVPVFLSVALLQVHLHIKRHLMKDLPESEDDIAQWCKDIFVEKVVILKFVLYDEIEKYVLCSCCNCAFFFGGQNIWTSLKRDYFSHFGS